MSDRKCIGYTDSQGKEICDGDIIAFTEAPEIAFRVFYDDDFGGFLFETVEGLFDIDTFLEDGVDRFKEMCIVGEEMKGKGRMA